MCITDPELGSNTSTGVVVSIIASHQEGSEFESRLPPTVHRHGVTNKTAKAKQQADKVYLTERFQKKTTAPKCTYTSQLLFFFCFSHTAFSLYYLVIKDEEGKIDY